MSVPRAYRREEFKIAVFSDDLEIKIISVRFSRHFLIDIEENAPFIYYSTIFSESDNICNLRQNSLALPNTISHLTSNKCCFQVFHSGNYVNVCILRNLCTFKTWVFMKTLNTGCSSSKKGGLILPKMPVKPEILKTIKNENIKVFLKKRGILEKKPEKSSLFCNSQNYCEKMTIFDYENLKESKAEVPVFVKINNGEIAFSENKLSKFQINFKIKNIENIRTYSQNYNLRRKNEKCLIIDFNVNGRIISKLFCSKEKIIEKFSKEVHSVLKISFDNKSANNNKKTRKQIKQQKSPKKVSIDQFKIAFTSNNGKSFTQSYIYLDKNAILDKKGVIFIKYEDISNCDICYNPIGLSKFQNGKCCFKFSYNKMNYTMCADDKQYNVILLSLYNFNN